MLRLHVGCCFHIGYRKANNEDNFLFSKKVLKDPMCKMGIYKQKLLIKHLGPPTKSDAGLRNSIMGHVCMWLRALNVNCPKSNRSWLGSCALRQVGLSGFLKLKNPQNAVKRFLRFAKMLLLSYPCFAVFDGMGGLPDGELASRIGAETLLQMLGESKKDRDAEWLDTVFHMINDKVAAKSRELGHQIGTTAAILLLSDTYVIIGNVGDSRVYRYANGQLKQISQDHSDRELLLELGVKERKPSLLQFVGVSEEKCVLHPFIISLRHCSQDRYIVCSDGLTDMVQDTEIEEICAQQNNPLSCAQNLVQCALKKGGKDNITVIVCDLDEQESTVLKKIKAHIVKQVE